MGFFFGVIVGAAASSYYWNRDACEHMAKRFGVWFPEATTTNMPGVKNYQLESEDYKLILNLIQKNLPKSKTDEHNK